MEQTASAPQLPAKHRHGPRSAADVPKIRRITALVRAACELMAEGQVKTIADAALMLGCSREHLSRMMGRDHVKDYLALAAKRKISSAVYRAAHVKVGLLDCDSSKVRNDVASDILAMGGIAPPSGSKGTSVNVNVSAGYVINLSGQPEQAPVIDATAEVIED